MIIGDTERPVMKPESKKGILLMDIKRMKIDTPNNSNNTIEVIRLESTNNLTKFCLFKRRAIRLMMRAPNAPNAPASVGVNIPE